MRDYYLANLDCLDENIGALMDALDELKLTDNTMVIFFSDNGGAPTNGATNTLGRQQVHPMGRRIRVPFILSHPGAPHAGKTSDQVISTLDIVPTCMDAAGIKIPSGLDGKPIVKSDEARNLFWRYGANSHAVRSGDWKLIHNGGRKDRQPISGVIYREEFLKGTRLFNLATHNGLSNSLRSKANEGLTWRPCERTPPRYFSDKRLQELYAKWSSEIVSQPLNPEK